MCLRENTKLIWHGDGMRDVSWVQFNSCLMAGGGAGCKLVAKAGTAAVIRISLHLPPQNSCCQLGCWNQQEHLHLANLRSKLCFIHGGIFSTALCQRYRLWLLVLAMTCRRFNFSNHLLLSQFDGSAAHVFVYGEWTCVTSIDCKEDLKRPCLL